MLISKEKYKEYQELKKYKLNNELEKAINSASTKGHGKALEEIKQLVHNVDCELIEDKIYDLLLKDYFLFCVVMEHGNLDNMCTIAIKRASYNLLNQEPKGRSTRGRGFINNVFFYRHNIIPNLLEAISNSARDKLFIREICVSTIEKYKNNLIKEGHSGVFDHAGNFVESRNVEDYHKTEEAIAKYCTRNDDGDYDVEPYYLLPIKDRANFKEFKQPFKDIYDAIKSNDFSKVESSLKQVEENIDKYSVDINNISEILTTLIREAKSNESIAHLISNFQVDVTNPKSCFESASISNKKVEKER